MATGMHVAASGMTGQPVVVLLHCMGRSGAMWDRHRALLAERFRVLAPDLPGHGKSAGPFTVTGAVTAVADALSRTRQLATKMRQELKEAEDAFLKDVNNKQAANQFQQAKTHSSGAALLPAWFRHWVILFFRGQGASPDRYGVGSHAHGVLTCRARADQAPGRRLGDLGSGYVSGSLSWRSVVAGIVRRG